MPELHNNAEGSIGVFDHIRRGHRNEKLPSRCLENPVKSGQSEAVIRLQYAVEVQGVVAQPVDVLGQLRVDSHQCPGRHRVALRE